MEKFSEALVKGAHTAGVPLRLLQRFLFKAVFWEMYTWACFAPSEMSSSTKTSKISDWVNCAACLNLALGMTFRDMGYVQYACPIPFLFSLSCFEINVYIVRLTNE